MEETYFIQADSFFYHLLALVCSQVYPAQWSANKELVEVSNFHLISL